MNILSGNIMLYAAAIMLVSTGCGPAKKMNKPDKAVATTPVPAGIIGNNFGKKGNTVLAAILGATTGGIAGGIIGKKMDRQAAEIKNEIPGAKLLRVEEGIIVTFDENNADGTNARVGFAANKYEMDTNSKLALDKLAKIFAAYPETNILIECHTDDVGAGSYNLSLSQKRAQAVAVYLKNTGVSASRITSKWYGKSQPKVANNSDVNRALNRRVEFAITANEKMKADAKKEADKL